MSRGPTIHNRRRAGPSPSLRTLWEPELRGDERAELEALERDIAGAQAELEAFHVAARQRITELRKARTRLQNKAVCRARHKLLRGSKLGDFGSRAEMLQESARRWRAHVKQELAKDD